MTTLLYLLIAALAFFVIGYLIARSGCSSSNNRYLAETPIDPHTEDDKSCEDEEIATKKILQDKAKAKKAKEEHEDKAKAEIESKAKAALMAEEETKAKAEIEAKATKTEVKATEMTTKTKGTKSAATKADAIEKDSTADKKAATKTKEDSSKGKTVKRAAPKTEDGQVKTAESGKAPEGLLKAPRGGKKDNITRIKGIGLKIEENLNSIGIYHFDQIATWSKENIAWADRELSFPGRAQREDWVGQAKLLAKGEETEFSKRVDKGEVTSSKKS